MAGWEESREKRRRKSLWTAVRKVTKRLISAREKAVVSRKALHEELKGAFRKQRLADLFRRQKTARKALNAWRLDTATSSLQTESVFLYLQKEDAQKVGDFLANESSWTRSSWSWRTSCPC